MRPFLWRKTRNVNRRALAGGAKKLYENEPKKKTVFFFISEIHYAALKIVTYVQS